MKSFSLCPGDISSVLMELDDWGFQNLRNCELGRAEMSDGVREMGNSSGCAYTRPIEKNRRK